MPASMLVCPGWPFLAQFPSQTPAVLCFGNNYSPFDGDLLIWSVIFETNGSQP